MGEYKKTYIRHDATAQPTKNVADELSGWPIKTMSDGKPTRSGTTEKRSRNGGRLHGRTGGPGPRAKDGLFATYGSSERGAYRDISVLNSAAGLVVAGLVPDMPAGVELAIAVIDDGRAANVLEGLVRVSRDAARS